MERDDAGGADPTERTLALVKPDGVARGLTGEVLRRAEAKGYRVVALRMRQAPPDLLREHYAEHVHQPWYREVEAYMTAGPVVAAVLEGDRVVEGWRSLMGPKDATTAAPGTIRGDLARDWGHGTMENLVHGSDSAERARMEIKLWFGEPIR